MKRIFTLILFIAIFQKSLCQNNDYEVLKAVLEDFRRFHPKDSIRLYEKPLSFDRQEIFFTENFLENYTFPVLGVDTAKVAKLITEVDFEYLRNNIRKRENWDLKKLPKYVILYSENSNKELNEKEQYKISKPIITEDGLTAFIYSYDICGYMDCSNFNVRVYRKTKKKWVFYAYIPI
ncbi:MAG: hypothetical protein EOO46_19485 [Flavobacterium sp.]|nr:MAG: hypothetical protein EOO46_19485 [Flavobacterium sp.]